MSAGTYEIIVTPDAEADLWELHDHIANTLLAPDTAVEYVNSIEKIIATLSEMPQRIKLLDDEPWNSRGVRKVPAENFYIYFRIADDQNRVYILNVIYCKRDQLKALTNIKV